jgi:hypothetical protein
MIGMMDDMRFLTERRHEALLAEAEARRLAKGSTDEVEEELSTNGHGLAKAVANTTVGTAVDADRTHPRALRAVHTALAGVSDRHARVSPKAEAPCDGTAPKACTEGQAAAA